jgi:hypothetical protein
MSPRSSDMSPRLSDMSPRFDTVSAMPTDGSTTAKERTFATSNYRRYYMIAPQASLQHDLLHAVNKMLLFFAARINPGLDSEEVEDGVHAFMVQIQDAAFANNEVLQNDVAIIVINYPSPSPHHNCNKSHLPSPSHPQRGAPK